MCSRNYCDYDKYFYDQAGGNLDISYYSSKPYQRGYGRFSQIARKFGIPAMKYLFKHGIEFGKDLYRDIRAGSDVKTSIDKSMRKRASSALKDLDEKISQSGQSQSGTGLRKKPRYKKANRKIKQKKRKPKSKINRRKSKNIRDIFG